MGSDADVQPRRELNTSWRRRIAWLVVLWLAGVAALALVAGLLRLVMRLAGLSS